MAIALVALSSLFNAWTQAKTIRAVSSARPAALPCSSSVTRLRHTSCQTPRTTPLRVVRLAEDGVRSDCAGRMVMSGRMVDICAELDRLVEREAHLTVH